MPAAVAMAVAAPMRTLDARDRFAGTEDAASDSPQRLAVRDRSGSGRTTSAGVGARMAHKGAVTGAIGAAWGAKAIVTDASARGMAILAATCWWRQPLDAPRNE